MKHQLLTSLILIGLSGSISSNAIADLGAADTHPQPEKQKQSRFDAWCIKKYADCSVKFEGGRLIVDESTGITSDQLIQWSRNNKFRDRIGLINFISPHHLYTYILKYKAINGQVKEGRIMFQNSKYSDRFYERLKAWSPSKEYRCVYNFDTRKESC